MNCFKKFDVVANKSINAMKCFPVVDIFKFDIL